jgi:hypothetical protein
VLSYVKGPSLLKSAGRGFWANEARVLELLRDAARSLRELHERACVPLEQGTGTPCSFDQISERFRTLFSLDRAEETALSEISAELRFRTSKATDQVLIQGDFWHGNLIRRPVSDQLVFIDWQFARWSSDVSIDLYLFPLAASFTAAPYGSAEARATAAAGVLSAWSRRLIPAYLQAYGQPSRYSVLPERDGMLAACVEKAARPALEYGYSHPDDLMWRYLFAELVSWPEENWEAFRQPEAAG